MAGDVKVGDRQARRHPDVSGTLGAGFEAVRDAFADNFAKRGELGGAVCVVSLERVALAAPWRSQGLVGPVLPGLTVEP